MPKIYCAIDTQDLGHACTLTKQIAPVIGGIKLGLEFFNTHGPDGLIKVQDSAPEASLFIDLKYHDIPNTVAGAIRALTSRIRPAYLNVHAAGGPDMMRAARDACPPETKLLAVTILTSMDDAALDAVGYRDKSAAQVERMAKLAQSCALDGVVCSAHEIELLRGACGDDFALMVPGIRPAGSDAGDQKRIMTPKDALDKGASHLVIGRPITQADDPVHAAKAILESL